MIFKQSEMWMVKLSATLNRVLKHKDDKITEQNMNRISSLHAPVVMAANLASVLWTYHLTFNKIARYVSVWLAHI